MLIHNKTSDHSLEKLRYLAQKLPCKYENAADHAHRTRDERTRDDLIARSSSLSQRPL